MVALRLLRCLGALVLVASASSFVPAGAAPDPDPKSEEQLEAAIGEVSQEELALLVEVEDVRARRSVLDARSRDLEAQIEDAAARAQRAEVEVARIDAELTPFVQEIARLEVEIADSRQNFDDAAAALYRDAGSTNILSLLAYADDPRSLVAGDRYLHQVSFDAEEEADRIDELKDDVDAAREQLEAQRRLADEARAAAEQERADVQRLRDEAEPARAAAEAEQAREEQLLGEITARKAEFEQELAALRAEQAALAQLVSRGGGAPPTSGNGRFIWPCDGPVTSGFGNRTHPITGDQRMHTGVDMGCANGAPIAAAGDGVVVEAGWRGGYGNAVLVDHGDGLATLYAHQSSLAVSPGQSVGRGDVVGYVGSTGMSTGPHLHWEVWVNGNPVDPRGYV
ncbi:MAG: murein hydrolase activator EnvC family protein [Acidimicrobiia bacterium]